MIVPLDKSIIESFRPYLYDIYYEPVVQGELTAYGYCVKGYSCGAVAAKQEGDDWTIVSLFVDPSMQGYGIGKALVKKILEQTDSLGAKRIRAVYHEAEQQTNRLDAFFQSLGFRIENLAQAFGITVSKGRQLPFFRSLSFDDDSDEHIVNFNTLSQKELESLYNDPEIPEFLNYTCCQETTRFDISKAYIAEGRVQGYLLLQQESPKTVVLQAAYVKPAYTGAIFPLLRAMAAEIVRCYPDDAVFQLMAVGKTSIGLTKKILGEEYRIGQTKQAILEK